MTATSPSNPPADPDPTSPSGRPSPASAASPAGPASPASPPGSEVDAATLLAAFANTYDAETGAEALPNTHDLTAWLRHYRLLGPREPAATEAQLTTALALRTGLRSVLIAHHDGTDPASPELDALSRALPLRLAFGLGGPRLEPVGSGVPAALARLLVAIADARADGSWPRLKLCLAEDCRYAFLDTSKNRSRHWCSMSVCGNRRKTRAYRARQRSTS